MSNVDKRKNFLINLAYLAALIFMLYFVLKFVFKNLMPFVVGFLIASLLKPFVRALDKALKPNKAVSIFVNIGFYVVIALLLTWAVFGGIALVQHYIPIAQHFIEIRILPMINDMLKYFEGFAETLDPMVADVLTNVINDLMLSLSGMVESFSKLALSKITAIVSSAPSVLISILLTVISSFFFSLDYDLVIASFMKSLPEKGQSLMINVRYIFGELIGKYIVAYSKLILLTFVELSIGFLILGFKSPFVLAGVISIVDILPVLGTGTILIPWSIYELILGDSTLGLGILVVYAIVTVIRNILEPKLVGGEIGLHPLVTLISIYVGLKMLGFAGLFFVPITVTIVKRLSDEGKLDIRGYFAGDSIINVDE